MGKINWTWTTCSLKWHGRMVSLRHTEVGESTQAYKLCKPVHSGAWNHVPLHALAQTRTFSHMDNIPIVAEHMR